ncbi:hypothetical protein O6H91_Y331800 [Diphasiastrum complanatum]|nr:hypothetical protein O6H91_Y331800 [Diphasiastrum complanatum]
MGKAYPVVHQDYQAAVEECREKLRDYINEKNCAPIVFETRMAFSRKHLIRSLGPGDLLNLSNSNLQYLTYADFYQLAGVAAVEAAGGPIYLFIQEGRIKSTVQRTGVFLSPPVDLTNCGTFLNAWVLVTRILDDATRIDLESKALGRRPPFISTILTTRNSFQGRKKGLIQLPSDKALLEDPKLSRYVERYAKDQDAFFQDYAKSHLKLSELGFADEEV